MSEYSFNSLDFWRKVRLKRMKRYTKWKVHIKEQLKLNPKQVIRRRLGLSYLVLSLPTFKRKYQ